MDEDVKKFLTEYLLLRERQKQFFRTRDRSILLECKRREGELDNLARLMLRANGVEDPTRPPKTDPRQGELFQ